MALAYLKKSSAATAFIFTLLAANTDAAIVSGSYGGIIDDDSGLGLLGETLRIDFSYDSDAVGSPSGDSTLYTSFLESFVVSAGANVWTWTGSNDSLFLWDDDVITTTSEDRVQLSVGGFTGPQLVPDPLFGISFSLFMSDIVPTGAPDGISGDTSLASVAPNPANFSGTGSVINQMALTFTYGAVGQLTADISTRDFANVSPIPVPAALWLFASASVLLTRRRRVEYIRSD